MGKYNTQAGTAVLQRVPVTVVCSGHCMRFHAINELSRLNPCSRIKMT